MHTPLSNRATIPIEDEITQHHSTHHKSAGQTLTDNFGDPLGAVHLLDVGGVLFFIAALVALLMLRGATFKQAPARQEVPEQAAPAELDAQSPI